jgi:hypothetical protein
MTAVTFFFPLPPNTCRNSLKDYDSNGEYRDLAHEVGMFLVEHHTQQVEVIPL